MSDAFKFGGGKALDIELEHWQTLVWVFPTLVLTLACTLVCQLDNISAALVSRVGLAPFLTTLSQSQSGFQNFKQAEEDM